MADKVVKPERRRLERRVDRLTSAGDSDQRWDERRTYCWNLESSCTEERRKRCAAHFVRRNCWDLWAAEYFPPGRKPCCHGDLDCSDCPITTAKFDGTLAVYVPLPDRSPHKANDTSRERPAGRCEHLLNGKANSQSKLDNESKPAFRCQHRPGIHLHSSYVTEVCNSREHRDCPFFDTD